MTFLPPSFDLSPLSKNERTFLVAVQSWIDSYASENSRLCAEREARRFCLWILESKLAFKNIDQTSIAKYRNFLRDPIPASRWIGKKIKDISSKDWRPFSGPLSETSIKTAISYLSSLFNHLEEHGVVSKSPVKRKKLNLVSSSANSFSSRSLSPACRAIISDYFEHTDSGTLAQSRSKLIVELGFYAGLRRFEIANARLKDIYCDHEDLWWINVYGKGNKFLPVPLPDALIASISKHRSLLLAKYSSGQISSFPVVSSLRKPEQQLTPHRIWEIFKSTVNLIADHAENTKHPTDVINQLRMASTHWLRHSYANFQLKELGLDIKQVQDNLRHASVSTTSFYLSGDKQARNRNIKSAKI